MCDGLVDWAFADAVDLCGGVRYFNSRDLMFLDEAFCGDPKAFETIFITLGAVLVVVVVMALLTYPSFVASVLWAAMKALSFWEAN